MAIDFGDLTSSAGRKIPASALRCFNLGGVDWLGRTFHKQVDVPQGKVQALWCGVAVPKDLPAGTYRGILTVKAKNAPATPLALTLHVADQVLADSGDSDLWRLSRLRWLDSKIALDDEVFAPYRPVTLENRTIGVLGRGARIADSGLLASITSRFSRNNDAVDAAPRELLAAPMRFVVAPATGALPRWQTGPLKIISRAPGAVAWETIDKAGPLELACRAKMECDGYVNFRLTLTAHQATDLKDIRLEIPLRREVAQYMMGMGCKGGKRPKQWRWKWDVNLANSEIWIGDVNAGLSCKLKNLEDRWDLFHMTESGVYRDWGNGGHGGATVEEVGGDQVLFRAFTGPRKVAAGEKLHFHFGLLITPVKMLDKNHWQWRYFHRNGGTPSPAEIAKTGAKIVNIHQGDALNPYINYPFAAVENLEKFIADAHARGLKVKLYYTIRELSNHVAEFWALRSLGGEIYSRGPGFEVADQFATHKAAAAPAKTLGGGSWLREHVVDGYVPAWHTPLGNGRCDAAIATVGLSRWHNYYLEGLDWLIRNAGVRRPLSRWRRLRPRDHEACPQDDAAGQTRLPDRFSLRQQLRPAIRHE